MMMWRELQANRREREERWLRQHEHEAAEPMTIPRGNIAGETLKAAAMVRSQPSVAQFADWFAQRMFDPDMPPRFYEEFRQEVLRAFS